MSKNNSPAIFIDGDGSRSSFVTVDLRGADPDTSVFIGTNPGVVTIYDDCDDCQGH